MPLNISTSYITVRTGYISCKVCFFFSHSLRIPLEFYACGWITALSIGNNSIPCIYSNTNKLLKNLFIFAFLMIICSWESCHKWPFNLYISSSHLENHSHKQPAPVMDTFFTPLGCRLVRASTVVPVICGFWFALW